ncbi:MAG: MarR family winged helix-turn-helix transcriptional regulator [Gammaproteobacteria bacterium]|nr:MarR family winged helix-turn-helix transcriptional regulator [Gammaproteobacteria bacterium]
MKEYSEATRTVRSELRLQSFLPYILSKLADTISVELSGIYGDEYGLSVPEWRIIANLAQHGTLNARQIVDFAGMEKSKVSRAVKRLTVRGLLTQQRASVDNRAKDLALTGAGETLYRAIVPRVLAWEKTLLEGLEVGEYRDLLYLLEKLGRQLHLLNVAPAQEWGGAEPGDKPWAAA